MTIGLPQTTAHHILMSAYTRMKESGWDAPEDGDNLTGVTNFDLVFKDVAPGNCMTLWANDFYSGEDVRVLQICWPDPRGKFPWQAGYSDLQCMKQDVRYQEKKAA